MKNARAFAKLLKVARAKTDAHAQRLGGLEAALGRTDASLRILSDAVHSEESAARAAAAIGFTLLAGYFEGAAQKRAALIRTKSAITAEIANARGELDAAFSEMKRLEHLVERAKRAAEDGRRKREGAAMDAAALARCGRAAGG